MSDADAAVSTFVSVLGDGGMGNVDVDAIGSSHYIVSFKVRGGHPTMDSRFIDSSVHIIGDGEIESAALRLPTTSGIGIPAVRRNAESAIAAAGVGDWFVVEVQPGEAGAWNPHIYSREGADFERRYGEVAEAMVDMANTYTDGVRADAKGVV